MRLWSAERHDMAFPMHMEPIDYPARDRARVLLGWLVVLGFVIVLFFAGALDLPR